MRELREQLMAWKPGDETEEVHKEEILRQWALLGDEIFERPDEGHFTASAIILNPAMDKMLMVYHNIYQSLSWTGGHADGEQNLMQKAMDEAKEETGIQELIPLSSEILSVDILPVKAHVKRGRQIAQHWHYNVAYGFIASDKQALAIKPDENSQVCWVSLDTWKEQCSEPHMIPVYEKIIARMLDMQQQKKSLYAVLADILLPWFADNARELPWRQDKEPYHIWLSEIMLQQTRVEAVKKYYDRWMEKLPDIKSLAVIDDDSLMKLWEGLGYYNRVRNIKAAAVDVVECYGGQLPGDYDKLLELRGIGQYTAGAISSIAFQLPKAAIDGNVLRVFSRILMEEGKISKSKVKKSLEKEVLRVMPKERPGDFNQALMDLGATVCLPNGQPICENCPWEAICQAHKAGRECDFPVKEEKKKRKIENKSIFLVEFEDKIAVHKRLSRGLLADLWEFPNFEEKITIEGANETIKSWKISDYDIEYVDGGKHIFSHVEWHMSGYRIRLKDPAEMECAFFKEKEWIFVEKKELLASYAIPSAFDCFKKTLLI